MAKFLALSGQLPEGQRITTKIVTESNLDLRLTNMSKVTGLRQSCVCVCVRVCVCARARVCVCVCVSTRR